MARLALLSVSDKTGLIDLAKSLVEEFGFDIISSGGTANALKAAGLPVTKVSDYSRGSRQDLAPSNSWRNSGETRFTRRFG